MNSASMTLRAPAGAQFKKELGGLTKDGWLCMSTYTKDGWAYAKLIKFTVAPKID